jgi:hypothetical protein
MSETAAPGWYPVEGDHRLRWWDGSRWTEQFHAKTGEGGAVKNLVDVRSNAPAEAVCSAVGKPVTGIGAGRYWLTPHHLLFEKGALRTDSQQVPVSGVVDVDVRQSMTQKARGVFTVLVHIQRSRGVKLFPWMTFRTGGKLSESSTTRPTRRD